MASATTAPLRGAWARPRTGPTWGVLAELATVSFYRVCARPVPVSRLRARVDHYRELCEAQRVTGTVILAPEGMNGSLAGRRDSVRQVLRELSEDSQLWEGAFDPQRDGHDDLDTELVTNEELSLGCSVPFARFKIKVKDEIIALKLDKPLDLSFRGVSVPASEWDELISQPDVVLVDTRNDFECRCAPLLRQAQQLWLARPSPCCAVPALPTHPFVGQACFEVLGGAKC
jgi:predicted sulfurtransferase